MHELRRTAHFPWVLVFIALVDNDADANGDADEYEDSNYRDQEPHPPGDSRARSHLVCMLQYIRFTFTDLYLTYGNHKASKAKSARIPPSVGFALVVITASSNNAYKHNTGTFIVIISSPYSRSRL